MSFTPPSPTGPPPPAYEFSQQEFDRKIAHVEDYSLSVSQTRQRYLNSVEEEEFERWDDAVFQANAARYAPLQSYASASAGAGSSSAARPLPNPHHAVAATSSSAPIRPLSIAKKTTPPAPAPYVKDRPSWLADAGLDTPPSSQPITTPPTFQHDTQVPRPRSYSITSSVTDSPPEGRRYVTNSPASIQQTFSHALHDDPEGELDLPPPPFAAVGPSLAGPAYEDVVGRRPTPGAARMQSPQPNHYSHAPPGPPAQQPVHSNYSSLQNRRDSVPTAPRPPSANRRPHTSHSASGPNPRSFGLPPVQFDASIAYAQKSALGDVNMQPKLPAEGATAFYSSAVSSHLAPRPLPPRQPTRQTTSNSYYSSQHNPAVPPPPPPGTAPAFSPSTYGYGGQPVNPQYGQPQAPGQQQGQPYSAGSLYNPYGSSPVSPSPVPQQQYYTQQPAQQYQQYQHPQYYPAPGQPVHTPNPQVAWSGQNVAQESKRWWWWFEMDATPSAIAFFVGPKTQLRGSTHREWQQRHSIIHAFSARVAKHLVSYQWLFQHSFLVLCGKSPVEIKFDVPHRRYHDIWENWRPPSRIAPSTGGPCTAYTWYQPEFRELKISPELLVWYWIYRSPYISRGAARPRQPRSLIAQEKNYSPLPDFWE
ncbi:hypothetical protein BOTBODRAFT_40818 [Botryobasidium botryosum FD-172 SS1]|uniref:Uncharacterized protein n=1 Tax=Botryobasidium botryosum (strain FD-172 SS1) TaxID=930990 RepID=A0A067N9E8_BOTB1|nr:hypothetical protein BOTBODRAFT_40818 [Botryobasidium botryosum FD-172 SS1]